MRSTEHAGSGPRRLRLVATIAGIVVALDAVTKAIAADALAGRGAVNLLGGHFHLELYRNFAGPGNILRGHPVLVSILSLTAVGLILVGAWSVRTTSHAVAIGLLLGGGIGKPPLDRLLRAPGPLRGGVVDWIKPTLSGGSLNLADLAINAGRHRDPRRTGTWLAPPAPRPTRRRPGAGIVLGRCNTIDSRTVLRFLDLRLYAEGIAEGACHWDVGDGKVQRAGGARTTRISGGRHRRPWLDRVV